MQTNNSTPTPAPPSNTSPNPNATPPINERALLFTLAGIQFTHILDFMIMMPLGPQFTAVFGLTDAQFGLLVSVYSISAAVSAVIASTYRSEEVV